MVNEYESVNIHTKWLDNIYNQISVIQDFDRLAREGCSNLMEYLSIPIESQSILLAEAQYKNLRFLVLELDLLISNLSPILKESTKNYKERIELIIKNINNRSIFLQDIRQKNRIIKITPLPFLNSSVEYVLNIKRDLIESISEILYLPKGETKKW